MKKILPLLLIASTVISSCSKKSEPVITSPIINPVMPQVVTFAGSGNPGWIDQTKTLASFYAPTGVAVDINGFVYVADQVNNVVREITALGVVYTLAGNGSGGFMDGSVTAAEFNYPYSVAVDKNGDVFVADQFNARIREVTLLPSPVVSTFSGRGKPGLVNGIADSTEFSKPSGVAVGANGNVYVADTFNNVIREISSKGASTTFAGSSLPGSSDGTGTGASFNNPTGLAIDSLGNLYVADAGNNKIRKITPLGVVTTLAGSGAAGNINGAGTAASFNQPTGVAVDINGNVYVADSNNNLVRKIAPDGTVITLAGTGQTGATNGPLTSASFSNPQGVATDIYGNVYVADTGNNLIRKILQ